MLGRNTEHTRTLRKTLVCTLLLSILLITLLNIKSVFAPGPITLTPPSGQVDLVVAVSGPGFSPSDTSCTISGTPVAAQACTISGGIVSPNPNCPAIPSTCSSFTVANVPIGVYTITVTGIPPIGPTDSATALFVVVAATCRPTPTSIVSPSPPPPFYPPPPVYQTAHCGTVSVSPGISDLTLGASFPKFGSVKLSYPSSSILTNSVGDLLFAVNLTKYGIYQSVSIYIDPDFSGLSSTTQVWTSFTNNYNPSAQACVLNPANHEEVCHPTLRFGSVGSTDAVAPNWWEVQIQNLKVSCPGPIDNTIGPDGLPRCPLSFVGGTDPSRGQFQANTTEYIRIFGVTSPTIAGRYFFKIFLNDTSIGANNFPTLVVKASKDPAYISGVLRYAENKNTSLVGEPIRLRPGEGAQVIA